MRFRQLLSAIDRDWRLIVIAAAIGLIMGGVATAFVLPLRWGFIRGLFRIEAAFDRLRVPWVFKPAIGAAVLGTLGLLYLLIFATEPKAPPFYGNGYPVIKALLSPEFYSSNESLRGTGMLIILLAALATLKAAATCLTIGSGGSGGLFAPSLLLGAAVGALFGQLVNALGLFAAASPAHYALVGMAAMLAATAHAPLTGILIVYEITLHYELILPLMLTSVISTIVGRLLYRDSIYAFKLTQMGVRLGAMSDLTVLRRLSVHDVRLSPAITVGRDASAHELILLSERHLVRDFVVVDDQQNYVGMVTGDDLSALLVYRESTPLLQVSELMRTNLPTVSEDDTLDVVLDKFSTHDAQSLAVLDGTARGNLRGVITRASLMERYQAALASD